MYIFVYIYVCKCIYTYLLNKLINIKKDKMKLININNYDQYLGYEITLGPFFFNLEAFFTEKLLL